MAKQTTVQKQLREFVATSKGKSYTVTIITLLLIMVLLFFAVVPAFNSILVQVRQNEERLEALASIDQKRENLRLLLNKHNENLAVAVGLQDSLPNELNQEGVVEELVQFTETSNAKLRSVRFVNLEGRSRLTQLILEDPLLSLELIDGVVVNLSIEGEKSQLRTFITEMESSRRIFSVKSLNISRVEQQGDYIGRGPFVLNMQAETYFWNVNQELLF